MNVGCRVIVSYEHNEPAKAFIKCINKKNTRALIEMVDKKAVSGKPQTLWISMKRLSIDIEWYRDKRINDILDA